MGAVLAFLTLGEGSITPEALVPVGDTVHAFWMGSDGGLWHAIITEESISKEVMGRCFAAPKSSIDSEGVLGVAAPGFGATCFNGGEWRKFYIDLEEGNFDVYGRKVGLVRDNYALLEYTMGESLRVETLKVSQRTIETGEHFYYESWDSVTPPVAYMLTDSGFQLKYRNAWGYVLDMGVDYKDASYVSCLPCKFAMVWGAEACPRYYCQAPNRNGFLVDEGEPDWRLYAPGVHCEELPLPAWASAGIHLPFVAFSQPSSPKVKILDVNSSYQVAELNIGGFADTLSFVWTADSCFWVLGEVQGELRLASTCEKLSKEPIVREVILLPGENAIRFVSKGFEGNLNFEIFSADGRRVSEGSVNLSENSEERVRIERGGVYIVKLEGWGTRILALP